MSGVGAGCCTGGTQLQEGPGQLMHSGLQLGSSRGAQDLFGGHRDDDGGGDLPGQPLGVQVLDQLSQSPPTTVGPVDVGPVRVPTLNTGTVGPGRAVGAGAEGRVLVRARGAEQVSGDGAVVQAPGEGLTVGQGLLGSFAQVVAAGCGHRLQHLAKHPRDRRGQQGSQLGGAVAQVTQGHRRRPVGPTLLIQQLLLKVISDFSRGLLRSCQSDLRGPIQQARVPEIYRTIGLDVEERIVRSEIRSSLRDSAANLTATELYTWSLVGGVVFV